MLKVVKLRINLMLPIPVALVPPLANLPPLPVSVALDPLSLRLLGLGLVLLVAVLQLLGNHSPSKLSPTLSVVSVLPRNHSSKIMSLVSHRRQVMRSGARPGLRVLEVVASLARPRINRPARPVDLAHLVNRSPLPALGLFLVPPRRLPRRASGLLGSSNSNSNSNHNRLACLVPSLPRGGLDHLLKQVGAPFFFSSIFVYTYTTHSR